MPKADALLYAALLRMGRRFRVERLPLMGVAGTDVVCHSLDWQATARRQLAAPPPGLGLADAAKLLTRLGQQLTTLLQAEEHTREALADWAALAASFSPRLRGSSSSGAPRGSPARAAAATAAAAAEEGMALLTRQAQELTDPLQHELESGVEAASQQGHELPAVSLDDLAAAVRQQHPALFASTVGIPAGSGSPAHQAGEGGAELRLHQAAALWDVLHRQQRFKYEPFEWVYEGLQPLLLPPWLHRRKLAPLTLGVVVAGVARRLGLPLLPVPADGGEDIAAGVIEGPAGGATTQSQLPLEQLRPDVAQRYAGRAQGMAPSAAPWVLLLAGGDCEGASGAGAWDGSFQWTHVLDACTGEAVDMAAAPTKYPTLQLSADWHVEAPLVAWQHMVRTIIQAHQRRGESDLVAHWVYVLLALDPQAAEWEFMLQPAA